MAELLIRWVTEVPPDRLTDVSKTLSIIEANPGWNPLLPFAELSMVHFASFTLFLFDDASPPLLVFESNVDRPFACYVRRLVEVGRKGLDIIYEGSRQGSWCYRASEDDAAVERFFTSLKRRPQLFHIGHPNRSVQEIRGDCELRRSIARELDSNPALLKLSPADIVRDIRRRAHCPSPSWPLLRPWNETWKQPPGGDATPLDQITWERDHWSWNRLGRFALLVLLAWLVGTSLVMVGQALSIPRIVTTAVGSLAAFASIHMSSSDARVLRGAAAAVTLGLLVCAPFELPLFEAPPTGLLLLALLILVLPAFLLVSWLLLEWRLMASKRRFEPLSEPLKERVRELLAAEDLPKHSHYNHVAGLSELKSKFRRVRWVRTWLVLFLLNLFYRTQFVKGQLVTIPSIHFAQWSLVNGRYLLFLTNYDGPADSYLDDFFNSLARGVAFIWHDTKPFPMTIDPRQLKVWVRKGQTLASARYRAAVYDGLTVGTINSNTYIRKRLLRGHGEASARRWLRRFATIPEEPSVLSRLSGWVKERAGVSG
jgi:hypothetical protein